MNIIVLQDEDGFVGKQVNHSLSRERKTGEGYKNSSCASETRIERRKTKEWYHLDLGEELEKCPAVAKSVRVYY